MFFVGLAALLLVSAGQARDITLNQAIDMAVNRSAQAQIIQGRTEVAEQSYYAERINFYLPEISINGELPAYSKDQSYRFFGGADQKSLFDTRDLNFSSFIELNQSVPITGGRLRATANLLRSDARYPDTRFPADEDIFVDELSNRGFLDVELDQQLFRPSAAKNDLKDAEADYEIARLSRHQEIADLKKEVIEAYMGVLQLQVQLEMKENAYEKAQLQTGIDSMKLQDEILSEDEFLESSSARLDAELEMFEVQTSVVEKERELAILLDVDVTERIETSKPGVPEPMSQDEQQRLVATWERSVPIQKAEVEYKKAERTASFAASGHGLTGDLQANFSLGRQDIEEERITGTFEDDIRTSGWGVSLVFKYPLWDGGAGNAAVEAARFEAAQAELEFDRAKKTARSEIINLVNQLDVSHRRLQIMQKQIDLANEKLAIAESRYEDGQISKLTYLEAKIFYLEARDKYLDELRQYLLKQVDLESKFLNA